MWNTSWFVEMPYEEQISKLLSFATPGAYIVMNFLGERDSWVPDMQFEAIAIEKLRSIVENSGNSLVLTNESEYDGTDRTGAAKHWHMIGAVIKKQ